MPEPDLATLDCGTADAALIGPEARDRHLRSLPAWHADPAGRAISRRFELRNFARAMDIASLAAVLAQQQNHHPDLQLGWGYCVVRLTSHDAGGLTIRDMIWAARLDAMIRSAGIGS